MHQYEEIFRRFTDLFRYFLVTEFSDYRPSVERRLPIIKKVLWQSQQHLQEGFRPMGVLDRVLCPGAFLSYNPARGAPEPMIHGPRPTTPTNNKNVPSLIRPGGMRACAVNSTSKGKFKRNFKKKLMLKTRHSKQNIRKQSRNKKRGQNRKPDKIGN